MTWPDAYAPPPLLGAHTAEVFRDMLGYDDARIGALLESGAAEQGVASEHGA